VCVTRCRSFHAPTLGCDPIYTGTRCSTHHTPPAPATHTSSGKPQVVANCVQRARQWDAASTPILLKGFSWSAGITQLSGMEIFVKDTSSSTTLTVNVPATANVAQLKAKIAARRSIHVEHQRLIFGGRVLEDGRCLADYHMSQESTVVMQYGPKFPFSWKPPPMSSAEDFTQPADTAAQRRTSVSTVLRGSSNISGNPFLPIRLFVCNAQVRRPRMTVNRLSQSCLRICIETAF
jgi:large subunit ribosomal protein L40e